MRAQTIAVVIPAYCEERLIAATIAGIPEQVSQIIVVDDASPDGTVARARSTNEPRLTVIEHTENRGVGAAIYSGYQCAISLGADVLVVMAGDNQMDGADLPLLVQPVLSGTHDYVKGNRLIHPEHRNMPRLRRWGTQFLARLTSWAAQTPIQDSQCGYTALSRKAALKLDWSALWPRYGYPNDLLIALSFLGQRIFEVPVRPIYASENSGLRPWHMLSIASIIVRRAFKERRSRRLLETRSASVALKSAPPGTEFQHETTN